MEDVNPWLDPECGNHKNKKSFKPELKVETKVEPKVELKSPSVKEERLIPGYKKSEDKKVLDFLDILVNDSLTNKLPSSVEKWAVEHFDQKWLDDFMSDVTMLKEEILSSNYFPTQEKMILLKLIFLLRQG